MVLFTEDGGVRSRQEIQFQTAIGMVVAAALRARGNDLRGIKMVVRTLTGQISISVSLNKPSTETNVTLSDALISIYHQLLSQPSHLTHILVPFFPPSPLAERHQGGDGIDLETDHLLLLYLLYTNALAP